MKSKFKVRDFIKQRSELFKLDDAEKKRWCEWKKEYGVENDFLEVLKDLKQVRLGVAHTNAFNSSVLKEDVMKIIVNFPFEQQHIYLRKDAPLAVEILAKIKKSDQIFK